MSTPGSEAQRVVPRQEGGRQWFAMLGSIDEGAVTPDLLDAHVGYLRRLMARGDMLVGGPLTGTTKRLRIYCAASIDEARDLVEADPYRVAGLLRYDLYAWRLSQQASARLRVALGQER